MDTERWTGRFTCFVAVLGVPFLRFLLVHEYGFFRAEVAAILLLFAAICAGLAVICRGRLFYAAVAAAIVLMSATAVNHALASVAAVKLRWVLAALTIGIAAAMYVLRKRFFSVLLLFVAAALAVDVGQAIYRRWVQPMHESNTAAADASPNLPPVVYLILDEQMGPEGLPADIPVCASAKAAIEKTFAKHNFTLYPFAYSNYRSSRDSIPSTINRKLLPRAGYYLDTSGWETGASANNLPENKLFADYSAKGYDLSVYQSDYIDFCSRGISVGRRVGYNANTIGAIDGVDWPVAVRFRQVLGTYLQADSFIWGNLTKVMPASLRIGPQKVGPLSITNIWPARILDDVVSGHNNRFVFAHLLTPHRPYIYDRSGRMRDRDTWDLGSSTTEDWNTYLQRYASYCEQVEFLMMQLDAFLQGIRNAGLYDSMTIIIHGDHGSRLRFINSNIDKTIESNRKVYKDDRYDYLGKPERRDLLDRFSTLLAIKLPGADNPRRIEEKGSILRFMWTAIAPDSANSLPGGVDDVYLYDAEGMPVAIPVKQLW